MAAIFDVVSAPTQLASLCCSLLRLLKSIKGASLTLQNYQLQLQDLNLLSNSISHNPLLQTGEIRDLTQSILCLIQKANLSSVLQKHRVLRTLYLFYREQELLDTLSAVERQKLSLCLSIEEIQSTTLYKIQADISTMANDRRKVGKKRVSATDSESDGSSKTARRYPNSVQTLSSPPESPRPAKGTNTDNNASSKATTTPSSDSNDGRAATASVPTLQLDTTRMDSLVPYVAAAMTPMEGLHCTTNTQYVIRGKTHGQSLGGRISGVRVGGSANVHVGVMYSGPASDLMQLANNTTIENVQQKENGRLNVGFEGNHSGALPALLNMENLNGNINNVSYGEQDDRSAPKRRPKQQYVGIKLRRTDTKKDKSRQRS